MENLKYYPSSPTETFSFDHVHIPLVSQVPMHQQETWELTYIITGSGIRIIGDAVENFSEGEVILIPPDTPHCWSFDKNDHDDEGKIEHLCLFFKHEFLHDLKGLIPELTHTISAIEENHNALSFIGETRKNLQELMEKMSSQNTIERLSGFMLILDQISSAPSVHIVGNRISERKNEKTLHEIYMFILNNFHRPIELDEAARVAGMPKSTFCLFFKRMTGKSFVTYLTDFRIESSCQMLLKTKLSVSEICVASGFNDIPYYNRIFRRIKNQTPTQYRNANI